MAIQRHLGELSIKGNGYETLLMTETSTIRADRRAKPRFALNAPLIVHIGDREIPAYTRDISDGGAYFYLAAPDSELIDRNFEFVLEMPPEITFSTWCPIRCQGQLLRKEHTSGDLIGIAAQILQYSIMRQSIVTA